MKTVSLLKLCVVILLWYQGQVALGNEFFQLGISAGNEDNVPRVLHRTSEAESGFFTVDFLAGQSFQPAINHTVTLAGEFSATRFTERKGFRRFAATASVSYAYKFGLGAYTPRINALLSYGIEEMDGDARDRDILGTEISFEKRLTPAWLFVGGLDYQSSDGKSLPFDPLLTSFGYDAEGLLPFDLYDFDAHSLFADLYYEFANGLLGSIAYNRTSGYTVASSQLPSLHIYKASKAVYVDPAWPDLWFAYRLKTVTDEWSTGISVPVARDASVDLGFSWQDIDGPGDRDYKNRLITLSYVQNF